MDFDDNGNPTFRGCPFVPFNDLPRQAQDQARKGFSPSGRQGKWRNIESWAFALKHDGSLAKCRFIEPAMPL